MGVITVQCSPQPTGGLTTRMSRGEPVSWTMFQFPHLLPSMDITSAFKSNPIKQVCAQLNTLWWQTLGERKIMFLTRDASPGFSQQIAVANITPSIQSGRFRCLTKQYLLHVYNITATAATWQRSQTNASGFKS